MKQNINHETTMEFVIKSGEIIIVYCWNDCEFLIDSYFHREINILNNTYRDSQKEQINVYLHKL